LIRANINFSIAKFTSIGIIQPNVFTVAIPATPVAGVNPFLQGTLAARPKPTVLLGSGSASIIAMG
jgi:hypothetical protein